MAKRKGKSSDGPGLYEAHEQRIVHRTRCQRALFIPRFLREAATDVRLQGAAQDHAHEIAIRWADLESNGYLKEHKETSIDTQFLDQLFGEGLC